MASPDGRFDKIVDCRVDCGKRVRCCGLRDTGKTRLRVSSSQLLRFRPMDYLLPGDFQLDRPAGGAILVPPGVFLPVCFELPVPLR